MPRRRSPVLGGYLVRDPVSNAWLQLSDAMLRATYRAGPTPAIGHPRRVLIAVGGHLGDAVLATSMFAPIRAALPGVEIGILTGSWNRVVFESHPAVTRVHCLDHWKHDRGGQSWPRRWARTRETTARVRAEISAARYDAAIDLYPYFPTNARLLQRCGVPVRIGYATGGDGPLFTHVVPFEVGRHVADDHAALVSVLLGTAIRPGACDAGPLDAGTSARVHDVLRDVGIAGRYVVMHMGAGARKKEWGAGQWAQLARRLRADADIVLTGVGASQRDACARLALDVPGVANLCDRLSWTEYRHVIAGAAAVISVDTVAAHLAAAAAVPWVAIMSGIDDPARWRPMGHGTLLSAPVPCAPCYRSAGCRAMSCVRDVSVESVLAAARSSLPGGASLSVG